MSQKTLGRKMLRRMHWKGAWALRRLCGPPGSKFLPHREISISLCQGHQFPWLFLPWVLKEAQSTCRAGSQTGRTSREGWPRGLKTGATVGGLGWEEAGNQGLQCLWCWALSVTLFGLETH